MPNTEQGGGHGSSAIEVAFARFEGAVTTELRNLTHDVKGVLASLAAYATTRDLTAATDRIDKLEKNQAWLIRTIVGTIVVGMVTAGAVFIAKGVKP